MKPAKKEKRLSILFSLFGVVMILLTACRADQELYEAKIQTRTGAPLEIHSLDGSSFLIPGSNLVVIQYHRNEEVYRLNFIPEDESLQTPSFTLDIAQEKWQELMKTQPSTPVVLRGYPNDDLYTVLVVHLSYQEPFQRVERKPILVKRRAFFKGSYPKYDYQEELVEVIPYALELEVSLLDQRDSSQKDPLARARVLLTRNEIKRKIDETQDDANAPLADQK